MHDVAQELAQHFTTSGAPVMCGGSTGRAITLLGVRITNSHPLGTSTTKSHPLGAGVKAETTTNASPDVSSRAESHTQHAAVGDNKNHRGDVQISFLALDPHYFGPDKLQLGEWVRE